MMTDKPSRLVPTLRFPEFRDDSSWSFPSFSELYDFKRTNTLSRDKLNYETGKIRNIHYGDIHTKFKPLFRVGDEHVPYVNPDALTNGFDDDAFCEEGDIVLADASEDIDDVGKAIEVVLLDGERVVAGTHSILATRRGNTPVVGFGGHLFQSAAVRTGIKKEAQGTKVHGISATRISTVRIPIPPTTAEQQKIADCLGSLDDLIAAEDRKLDALRRHKQGLMQQLFPRPDETVPRLRFPEFRDLPEWDLQALSSASDVNPKNDGLPERFIYIDLESVKNSVLTERKEISRDAAPSRAQRLLSRKDIIYQTVRPYQRNNFFFDINDEWEYVASTGYAQLRAHESSEFLYQLLHTDSFVSSVLARCTGSNYPAINPSVLASINVLLPQKKEQQKIADCLGSLDDLIATEDRKLDALRRHKKGLMQQLFPSLEDR